MKRFEEEDYIPYLDEEIEIDPIELAWDHALDISASIYSRLAELGMNQKDLADILGVTQGRVSQIIKGDPGMSIKKLAEIEVALGFDLGSGFHYAPEDKAGSSKKIVGQQQIKGWMHDKPATRHNVTKFTVLEEAA